MKTPSSKKTPSPRFITLEGTEGSGKSSLIQALKAKVLANGHACITTREPGGAKVAEKIREILIHEAMHPMTELFLYEAARAEHYHTVIAPALRDGAWVLCDRFTDSSLAYQGTARGIDRKIVRELNAIATEKRAPDYTIFLDIDPEAGLKSATDPNKFEREGVSFQEKVRAGYLRTIREEPARFIRLTAKSGTPEELADAVLRAIEEKRKGGMTKKTTPSKKRKSSTTKKSVSSGKRLSKKNASPFKGKAKSTSSRKAKR